MQHACEPDVETIEKLDPLTRGSRALDSGSSPYAFKLRASSAMYLRGEGSSKEASDMICCCVHLQSPQRHCRLAAATPRVVVMFHVHHNEASETP